MPPQKKGKARRQSDEDAVVSALDVQYNPDIIEGILQDLAADVDAKCHQIQKEIDFMATSIQQSFHLELIKIPAHVKSMPISKFLEEYGDSLEAVAKGVMHSKVQPTSSKTTVPMSAAKSRRAVPTTASKTVFQTPASNKQRGSASVFETPSTSLRIPVEGENILSANGSPLGVFSTAVKPPKPVDAVPATPGGFVTLKTGDTVGIEDVERLTGELREEALEKMQSLIENVQAMMAKIRHGEQKSEETRTARETHSIGSDIEEISV